MNPSKTQIDRPAESPQRGHRSQRAPDPQAVPARPSETGRGFDCFGGSAAVFAGGGDRRRRESAVEAGRKRLLAIHNGLSRFLPDSELSLLNRDPRGEVPASRLMLCFARAVRSAGALSDGLVDATCLPALLAAGYDRSRQPSDPKLLGDALASLPERGPAHADPTARWRDVQVDEERSLVVRPAGVQIDSGGLAKGLAADLVGADLLGFETWAVDCGGDILVGGRAGLPRKIDVSDPFGGRALHTFAIVAGAIATSGIGRRSWRSGGGWAHHLIDPRSGRPAYTGIVQATAIGRTGFEAEVLAKAALLVGPDRARGLLSHGGLLVFEDRTSELVADERGAIAL